MGLNRHTDLADWSQCSEQQPETSVSVCVCCFQINYKVYKTVLGRHKGKTQAHISNLLICLIWKEDEGDNFDL